MVWRASGHVKLYCVVWREWVKSGWILIMTMAVEILVCDECLMSSSFMGYVSFHTSAGTSPGINDVVSWQSLSTHASFNPHDATAIMIWVCLSTLDEHHAAYSVYLRPPITKDECESVVITLHVSISNSLAKSLRCLYIHRKRVCMHMLINKRKPIGNWKFPFSMNE